MRIILTLILINFFIDLSGQDLPPIQTDRPDQTECPFITPVDHIQFEYGFNYEKLNSNTYNFLHPSLLSKWGLNKFTEIRLITEVFTEARHLQRSSGLKPLKIGFKTKLLTENGLIPTTSIIAHLSVPDFRTNKIFAPSFRFTMQHTLSDKMTIGYNLGSEWSSENLESTIIYTLAWGISLTQRLGSYIELYGFYPQNEKSIHKTDGGFTFLIKPNFMIDISSGVSFSEIQNYYTSLGLSFRFHN